MAQHFPDDTIARRIDPIVTNLTVTEKIDNRPGIIDFCPTKEIAVIPFLQVGQRLRHGQVFRHLCHFLRRKSNDLPIGSIHDGTDIEIIQITENTFLGDPQDPCQYGKI